MTDYRKRLYDKYATYVQGAGETFDAETAERWGRAYDHYLRGWLPEMKSARIADLASGNGSMLYFLKQRGYTNLAGTDVSPEQVALSRQVVPDVRQQDAVTFLKDQPNSFDLLTGFDVIEHLSKDEALEFLDACYAALKPGGRLILQTPNAESPWGTQLRYADPTHENAFTPDSLRRIMNLCGFADVESRELGPVPWEYSAASTARYVLWRVLRQNLILWNYIETGSAGSGVFTRVFNICARKSG